MKRAALIGWMMAMLMPAVAHAVPDTVPKAIFRYECSQANVAQDGFTCSLNQIVHFNIPINWKKLSKEKRAYYEYKLNKMIYRIYQMGGSTYELTSVLLPPGTDYMCNVRDNGSFFLFCQKEHHQ